MRKTRRELSPEFKREVVALLESSGRPQMQIAQHSALDAEELAGDPKRGVITKATRTSVGASRPAKTGDTLFGGSKPASLS